MPSRGASHLVYHNGSGATVDYLEHLDGPPLMIADPWPIGPSAIVPTPIAFRVDGTPKAPNGDPCGTGAQCLSGNCVDSVCCDTACGGGVTEDCMACGVAAGGTTDGVCGPLDSLSAAGVVCHAATGLCEQDSVCSDTSTVCPDNFLSTSTVCRCDPEEVCDGASTLCPPDVRSAAGTECAPATGAEDGGLSIDAGDVMMTADAGPRDASVSAGGDGAIADAGTDVRTEGCGIAPGGAPRWPAAWFLVGAALCLRRRRR